MLGWTRRRYQEACIRLRARAGYKVTNAEVEEAVKEVEQRDGGHVLNRSKVFWDKFIKGGRLDEESLMKRRFRREQIPYIKSELGRLGWLET